MTLMAEQKRNERLHSRERSRSERKKPNRYAYAAVAIVVIAVAAASAYVFLSTSASVPFSTFKSGFQSAPRVGVVATYSNQSQYAAESPCFTSIIQVIARSRKASTIDFFIINQQNDSCIYSATGLGGSISTAVTNSSHCIGIAESEPSIFLNYSTQNSTHITSSRMYVYGNSRYMAVSCPTTVAVELG